MVTSFSNEGDRKDRGMQPLLSHLSLFVTDRASGIPIARMPFYAEIGMPPPAAAPPAIDHRSDDALLRGLREVDPEAFADGDARTRLIDALAAALSRMFGGDVRDRLAQDPDFATELGSRVWRQVRDAGGGGSLRDTDTDDLAAALEAAIRAEAAERALPLAPAEADPDAVWSYPLGILATDHVGYLSFDLARLPGDVSAAVARAAALRQRDPAAPRATAIWLYPLLRDRERLDALAQGRIARDAVVVKLALDEPDLPPVVRNLGILAMQRPDLTDWRLSPASFATNPGTLVGDDGCESLLPANVALQEYFLYQVVRLNDVQPAVPGNLASIVRPGVVHEYRVAWYPLGHSLGEIRYSMALAPGESVNLAVIDWTRRDDAQRAEHTTLDEQIVHDEHRDRTITETVDAAVRELQHGSSFMGGIAESVGASGAAGVVGIAAGIAGSLGGSTASSDGSRALSASTTQRLSDHITQASAAKRELQSTVVVHAAQAEKESIETRTVVNYNHSHALTILYYEVLRHFRVVTELRRRRPAVLVRMQTDWLADANIDRAVVDNRATLKAALLDAGLADHIDALARIAHRRKLGLAAALPPAPALPPPPAPSGPPTPRHREFVYFTFHMTTGDMFSDKDGQWVDVRATLIKNQTPVAALAGRDPGGPGFDDKLNQPGSFRAKHVNTFVAALAPGRSSVMWGELDAIDIDVYPQGGGGSDISFARITIIGRDTFGQDEVLVDNDYALGHVFVTGRAHLVLPLKAPPLPPAPAGRPADEVADDARRAELVEHLQQHRAHYMRALALSQNAADRAQQLDAISLGNGTTVLDLVENRPLEVIGDYVAYPSSSPAWDAVIEGSPRRAGLADPLPDERLVTLPTRGVFAEAKLGHCNASELIDNTRFWDWQQSPVPHLAPEIAAVQPVTPQPQQQSLQTTPFPQSLVNIVNPPAAPDPAGLAAALGVLATPNLFRDMSGQAQVADLLKKLSDNTISIAEASSVARQLGQRSSGSTAGGGVRAGDGVVGGPRAAPTQPSAANRDLHDLQNVLGRAQQTGLMTPQQARATYARALEGTVGAKSSAGDPLDAGDPLHGELAPFVQAGRLNARVAETLASFMSAPLDSWRRMAARFALGQLETDKLIGIVAFADAATLRARFLSVAADPQPNGETAAALFTRVTRVDGSLGRNLSFVNKTGMRSSFILLAASVLDGTARIVRDSNNTHVDVTLAETLVHELNHVRNQDGQQMLRLVPDSAASVYVDPALAAARTAANPPDRATVEVLRSFVEEMCARHVHWRVRNEQLGAGGTLILQPEELGVAAFEYFQELPGVFDRQNGYVDQIRARPTAVRLRQVALWLSYCQFYSFSDVPAQNQDAKEVFRLAAEWAMREAGSPTPLASTMAAEGLAPLLRDFV